MEHLETLFLGLHGSGYVVTSPMDDRYNGVAWAADDREHWWWPDQDSYWPEGAPREETIAAYGDLGFVSCDDPLIEAGYEKVAIYAALDGTPTHVARQLPSGLWSSKLGQLQDIQHQLEDLAGSAYGACARFLKRGRQLADGISIVSTDPVPTDGRPGPRAEIPRAGTPVRPAG